MDKLAMLTEGFAAWNGLRRAQRHDRLIDFARGMGVTELLSAAPALQDQTMPGPTGETNTLMCEGRGIFLCWAEAGLSINAASAVLLALMAGNSVLIAGQGADAIAAQLRQSGVDDAAYTVTKNPAQYLGDARLIGVAFAGSGNSTRAINQALALREDILVPLIPFSADRPLIGRDIHRFITEKVVTINTTAIGGNASLLELGSGVH